MIYRWNISSNGGKKREK